MVMIGKAIIHYNQLCHSPCPTDATWKQRAIRRHQVVCPEVLVVPVILHVRLVELLSLQLRVSEVDLLQDLEVHLVLLPRRVTVVEGVDQS